VKKENVIITLLVIAVILSAVSIAGVFGIIPGGGQSQTINVSGSASTFVKPDVAYIDLGINVTKDTAKAAIDEANKNMNLVIGAVKVLGVKDEDIQTSNFWVSANYNYNYQTPLLTGYNVTNTVTVKTTPDQLNNIVLDTVDKGANNFSNVRFDLSNKDEVKSTLIDSALANARKKADTIVQDSSKKITDFKTISVDFTPESFNPYLYGASGGAGDYTSALQMGSNEIKVTVYAVFEVK
jgi:uncharacterized protein YggE